MLRGVCTWYLPSCRDLDQRDIRRERELPDEQNRRVRAARIGGEWYHGRRSGVPHHLELSRRAVRKAHGVLVQVYDPSAVDSFTGQLHYELLLNAGTTR